MFSGSIEVEHWLKMDQRDQRDLLTFCLTLMVQTKKSKQTVFPRYVKYPLVYDKFSKKNPTKCVFSHL